MNKLYIIISFLFAIIYYGIQYQMKSKEKKDILLLFEKFKQTYQKSYCELENDYRFQIFQENYLFIEQINNNPQLSYKLEVNEFTDLDLLEFKVLYFGRNQKKVPNLTTSFNSEIQNYSLNDNDYLDQNIPDEIDWRQKLATPIQKQGKCGSCWAFSTIVALEAAYAKETGNIVKLSEQNLMDCCRLDNRSCNGGDPQPALECVIKLLKGIMNEKDYPYQGKNRNDCDFNEDKSVFKPDEYINIPPNNQLLMKKYVSQQPISICLSSCSKVFQFYKQGIIDDTSGCRKDTDHCVGLVGYGIEGSKKYWIVKNQWGDKWGEKGYVRIFRSESTNSVGTCAIASSPRIVKWKKS